MNNFPNPSIFTAKEKENFVLLKQGNEINSFLGTTAKKEDIKDVGDDLHLVTNGDFMIFIEEFSLFQQKLQWSSKKVFWQMHLKHFEGKNTFTLQEYMNLCGLKDKSEAGRQLRHDINLLWNTSIKFKDGDKIRLMDKINESELYNRGIVKFNLSESYKKMLDDKRRSFWACYPLAIFLLPELAGKIAFKLIAHYAMNATKTNGKYISTKTLMEATQLTEDSVKSYETSSGGRQLKQKIAKPIEKALDTLVDKGILKQYALLNARKQTLTDEELENHTFREWENYSYFFELIYPEEAIEQKQKAIKKRKAKQAQAERKVLEKQAAKRLENGNK